MAVTDARHVAPGRRLSSRRRRRRTATLAGLALFVAQTAGCYTYAPRYTGAPSAGDQMAFVITDQGRVALADQMGSGVTRVMGRVASVEGDEYVVAVDGVETIAGGTSHWTGERIHLRKDFVAGVQQRQFSRGRTTAVMVAAAVVLGALIAVASVNGFGFSGRSSNPPPPSGS